MSKPFRIEAPALRRLGLAACVVVLVELIAVVLLGRGLGGGDALVPYPDLVGDVAIVASAALLTTQRPANAIGWLLLTFALLGATQNLGSVYGVRALRFPGEHLEFAPLGLSAGNSLWIPALFVPITLLPVLYPDGKLPAPWWRWVNRAAVAGMMLATIVAATDTGSARDDVAGGRPVAQLPLQLPLILGVTAGLVLAATTILSVGGLFVRLWRAVSPQRQQMLWLVTTALVTVPALFVTQGHWYFAIALALVPLAIAVGVLRYRLLGIELAIRRFFVYTFLTAIVVGIYAAVSAFISALVPTKPIPAVVAAAAVAVALSPVRDRLQRLVDRLVYGARHDPIAAVTNVGAHVSAVSPDPLVGVVSAIAGSIRASYVAVADPAGTVLAATGDADATHQTVRALSAAGQHVGDLTIAPAAGEPTIAKPDARVIDALAVPLAVLLHARRLNRELAAARERLMLATEAERTRLRHDLHDGLGPSLSGVALGLEAVQLTSVSDPERSATIVDRLRTEVAHAVEEVRRIIDALRPEALDRGGLDSALRERVAAVAEASGLTVDLDISGDTGTLSDETAVAVYRIVDEALTNVVRHAQATRCTVRVDAGTTLTLDVRDNGRGWTAIRADGIGLSSMRRRAEALGGEFGANGADGGQVLVRLPMLTLKEIAS